MRNLLLAFCFVGFTSCAHYAQKKSCCTKRSAVAKESCKAKKTSCSKESCKTKSQAKASCDSGSCPVRSGKTCSTC